MDEYSGDRLLAISGTMAVLITVFVGLRLYTRLKIKKAKLGLDDYLVAVALICCLGMCGVGIASVTYGYVGYHAEYATQLDPQALQKWGKIIWILEPVYLAAISLPKLSILALYNRVFPVRWMPLAVKILAGLVLAFWLSFQIASLVECIPIEAFWDKSIKGRCFDVESYFKYTSLPSALIDLPILLLPIPILATLNAAMSKRLFIIGIFMCGSLGIIACCARMGLFFARNAFKDPTWASVYLVGMSVIEPSLYLIAACVIALKPLISKILEVTRFSSRKEQLPSARSWHGRSTDFLSTDIDEHHESHDLEACEARRGWHAPDWLGTKLLKGKVFFKARGSGPSQDLNIGNDVVGMRRDVWVRETPR